MTITYQIEHWSDIEDELRLIFDQHWKEIALNHTDIILDPSYETYRDMDIKGILHVVTVRDDLILIGYHVSMVNGHLHYASTKHAQVDIYYLKPEYRKGRTGIRMFQFAESSLKDLGVKKIFTGTKKHLDHSKIFEHLGYNAVEIVFTKIL